MEFAAAALTSIGSTVGAGATAVATAATGPAGIFGLGTLLPSAATATSILAGGATVLSVLNAGRTADAKSQALNAQADDADTQGTIEQVQGITRRASMKQGLVQALGQRDVATAAGGTDLSFGTAAVARQQAVGDADRALSIDSDTTTAQVARLRERAGNLRKQAVQTQAGGLGTQAALAVEGAAKFLKRG